MSAQEIANILLKEKAVTLSLNPPYHYTSGLLAPIYCDNRLLTGSVEARNKIVDYFVQLIQEENLACDVVAGTATAAISWAAWIADRLNKPMVYVRSKSKSHGKQNQIEGGSVSGKKVLLVEDLVSKGGSAVSSVEALREAGASVTNVVAIFTYELPVAKQAFDQANCSLSTLTSFSTLVTLAPLSEEDRKTVLEWNKDSENWGKRMGFE